ncbi:MAG: hypothetical protein HOP23_01030 [Methylococcaceae bacterium]|nr:hypothetical protein [Methylococcaceae bacterium]
MKTLKLSKVLLFTALVTVGLSLTLSGCSDDEENKTTVSATEEKNNPFDHTHDVEVTDIQKHKFEHDFARQCVERELKNSVNKEEDRERFTEPCMCIATYMMKDLTAQEAEKFITEHENPRSLQIKFDSAAYHCLQQKSPPKEPQLFGKQKSEEAS